VDELFQLYKRTTAQDNILIIDLPPDRSGRLREKDIQLVLAMRKKIDQRGK
jgi:alpha-L-fucosidase